MSFGHPVKKVQAIGGYRLRAEFQDGYLGEVDLWPLFEKPRGPLTEPFRDAAFFAKVYVDLNAAAWPNGYDIDPEVLRYYCETGRVCSQEELAAAFARPENASMSLNEREEPGSGNIG